MLGHPATGVKHHPHPSSPQRTGVGVSRQREPMEPWSGENVTETVPVLAVKKGMA